MYFYLTNAILLNFLLQELVTDGGASWDIKWDFAYQCKSDKWLNHKRHSPSKNNQPGSIDEPKEKSHLRYRLRCIFLFSLIDQVNSWGSFSFIVFNLISAPFLRRDIKNPTFISQINFFKEYVGISALKYRLKINTKQNYFKHHLGMSRCT